MTTLGRLMSIYPALHLLSCVAVFGTSLRSLARGEVARAVVDLMLTLVLLYLVPPLLLRVHSIVHPLTEGFEAIVSTNGKPRYSPWWGSHQVQLLFIACPTLEALLRLVPGAYSLWLRLWGAKIGKNVYWTPRVEIVDRSLLDVGSHVVFGHHTQLCAHVITPSKRGLRLYVKRISIGEACLLGAHCRLGPGVQMADHCELAYGTEGRINQRFEAQMKAKQAEVSCE